MRKHIGHLFGRSALFAFAIGTAATPARAVDIINKDKVLRVVAVNDSNGDSNAVTLPPKQQFVNVCKSCVILLGNTSVEADGNVVVVIEGGKVSIPKKK